MEGTRVRKKMVLVNGRKKNKHQIHKNHGFPQKDAELSVTFDLDLKATAFGAGDERELLGLVHGIVCACNHNVLSRLPAANIVQQMKLHSINNLHPETGKRNTYREREKQDASIGPFL